MLCSRIRFEFVDYKLLMLFFISAGKCDIQEWTEGIASYKTHTVFGKWYMYMHMHMENTCTCTYSTLYSMLAYIGERKRNSERRNS